MKNQNNTGNPKDTTMQEYSEQEAEVFLLGEEPARYENLKVRTKRFALDVIKFCGKLPQHNMPAEVLGKQVLRSGTSIGAQYREATRARSSAEFVSKIDSSLQEIEETGYWLELLVESGLADAVEGQRLQSENAELNAIFTSSSKTAKANKNKV